MATDAGIDSTQYAIAYTLTAAAEFPRDFSIPAGLASFDSAVFLPRDDPDWFGRSAYPARILVLQPDRVLILPHPKSGERPHSIALADLVWIESGHILLHGWLRLVGRGLDRTLYYNTRYRWVLDAMMRRLRGRWLGSGEGGSARDSIRLGEAPDFKFEHALARELDEGEFASAAFFRPAVKQTRRWLGFRLERWEAADLVAFTPVRLLWITDRDRGGYARYGAVARYAPRGRLRAVVWEGREDGAALAVSFDEGPAWRVPMFAGDRQAAAGLEEYYVESCLHR